MKRIGLVIAAAALMVFAVIGCDKKEKNTVPEDVMVGTWQLTNVDFSVMPTTGIPASDACIVELVSGYDFREDGKFYFVLNNKAANFFPDPYANDYWNWTGTKDSLVINQKNNRMPPYNFGFAPTNVKFEKSEATWTVNFDATLSNGSTAHFKLVKTDAIDKTKEPAMTNPEGNSYECNFFGQ
ncbi:MAG TPA: hypothetical protein PKX92_13225 [Edaphocola sp.]|nr:hypothetical protein [Edaphocola sp.]